MSETEKMLELLFGENTDAKNEFLQLKDLTELENTPEVLKNTIVDSNKSVESSQIETVTQGVREDLLEDDNISSHNSTRAMGEEPITNNSNRVIEDEKSIASNNATNMHEQDVIEGAISTDNFVEELL